MKRIERVLLLLLLAALVTITAGCGAQGQEQTSEETMNTESTAVTAEPEVAIDGIVIPVTWEDNEAADALLEAVAESPDGNQMVIFYGSNQWSYTRLGSVDLEPSELTDLLGDHDVTLTIHVAE